MGDGVFPQHPQEHLLSLEVKAHLRSLDMHIREETTKLSAIRQALRTICRGHSVSHGRYEHMEYWFSVDDGKVGTVVISAEWLDGIPLGDIDAELQRKGLTLQIVMQASKDHCLVVSDDELAMRSLS
jgi:hypothetical protein